MTVVHETLWMLWWGQYIVNFCNVVVIRKEDCQVLQNILSVLINDMSNHVQILPSMLYLQTGTL